MWLKKWVDLPQEMRNDSVRKYYDELHKRRPSLVVKRLFDMIAATILLLTLLPVLGIIGLVIKFDSKGPALFRQTRVTRYGKHFQIIKFRTMVVDADQMGTQVTINNDTRITKVGRILRKYRLDEIPQLLNIISGDMSFVGTRPEVVRYVEQYTDEMMATLLMPAGITSQSSILYKDEEKLLAAANHIDKVYIEEILPKKMLVNLKKIREFSLVDEIKIMFRTLSAVYSMSDRTITAKIQIENTVNNNSQVKIDGTI